MAAGSLVLYNGVAEWIGDGTIDMDNDTFAMRLLSSSYTPAGTHDVPTDLTGELSTANGYTSGGATLTGVTWTRSTGVAKFTSDAATWTASGGSIVARYAVIVDVTAGKLIGYALLDAAPADVTTTDTNTLTVNPHVSNGWFLHSVNA